MDERGVRLIPFYLVIDVSFSMDGPRLQAANRILPSIVDALARNPILSDKVRFGLIDFSDTAQVRLPLCDLLDPALMIPELRSRGGTSYASAFNLLAQEIPQNIALLKADGYVVHRPAVFFLSDGAPSETPAEWTEAYRRLVSTNTYPNIIPLAVADADVKILASLAHPSTGPKAMSVYIMEAGFDPAKAITGMAEVLISSVIASGSSLSSGTSGVILPSRDDLPDGITAYDVDDDF